MGKKTLKNLFRDWTVIFRRLEVRRGTCQLKRKCKTLSQILLSIIFPEYPSMEIIWCASIDIRLYLGVRTWRIKFKIIIIIKKDTVEDSSSNRYSWFLSYLVGGFCSGKCVCVCFPLGVFLCWFCFAHYTWIHDVTT